MILKAIIEDQEYTLKVPEAVLDGATEFFDRLDRDMDQGWQMSRQWVDAPDRMQRCQIVADKLMSALEKENHRVGMLMAGYILSRLPDVEAVEIDIHGEIQNNELRFRKQPPEPPRTMGSESLPDDSALGAHLAGAVPAGLSTPFLGKIEAMTQAGNDVTKVFRVGKAWRFSVYDHLGGRWQDSPLMASEEEAERLRQAAFKERYDLLVSNASAGSSPGNAAGDD